MSQEEKARGQVSEISVETFQFRVVVKKAMSFNTIIECFSELMLDTIKVEVVH